jgi:hypothetical protein
MNNVYTMYIHNMYMYLNVYTMYVHVSTKYVQYLWIHSMKAVFSQLILQVLTYPLCQFGWQPTQDRMSSPVDILQPLWRGM